MHVIRMRSRLDRLREQVRSPAAITLVELMVALFLLGIIFSAVAGVLTSSLRAVVAQERRVEATSIMTQLHEQFQTLPWDDAAIYETDLALLAATDLDITGLGAGETPEFEGRPIVVRPEDPERNANVPLPVETRSNESGRTDFQVLQVVTWSQGEGESDLLRKRLTTVVRWRVLERDFEARLTSERAPIGGDFGDPRLPLALQFILSPSQIDLDEDGSPTDQLLVSVTFNRGVTTAELRFNAVVGGTPDAPILGEQVVTLTPSVLDASARGVTFTQELDLSSYVLPNGPRLFTVVGTVDGVEVEATGLIVFNGGPVAESPDEDAGDGEGGDGEGGDGEGGDGEGGDGEGGDGEGGDGEGGDGEGDDGSGEEDGASRVSIAQASVSPSTVRVGSSNNKFCDEITIRAQVQDLDPESDFQIYVQLPPANPDMELDGALTSDSTFELVLDGIAGVTASSNDIEIFVAVSQGGLVITELAGTVSFQSFANNCKSTPPGRP